jgi:signal transduction histidine kinase
VLFFWLIVCSGCLARCPALYAQQKIDSLNKLASQYLHRQLDTCFFYLSAARNAARHSGYKKGEAQVYRTLGAYYACRDNSYLSFRFYLDALKTYEALGDSAGICLLNMDIGTYYQFEGKHREAAPYITKAMDIGHRIHQDSLYLSVLAKYYFIYRSDSLHAADAVKALFTAGELAEKYGNISMVLYTGMLEADELLDKGDTAKAVDHLSTMIAESFHRGYAYHAMYGLAQMAEYKSLLHQSDSLYYQREMVNIGMMAGYRELVLPQVLDLYAHYAKYGPADSAAHYSDVIMEITEKREKSKTQGELEYVDYYMQEKQLRELQLQHDYQRQLLDKKAIGTRDRYIIIIALILLLLLTILLLADVNRSYRRSGKNAKHLGEMNREISEKNVLLRTHDDFKNKLISLIAHDFRAPLIHITDITTLLKDQLLTFEEAAKLFRKLEGNSQHTLHVFDNILRWISSQLSGFVYTPVPCSPAIMITEALQALKENCEEKSLQINRQLPEDISVLADREMLQFVHRNLLHNAVKFSLAGGTIYIYAEITKEQVTIFFKDEGKGIQPDISAHIFEYQDTREKNGGAGLALIICKDFMDKMNGTIQAVNNPDKGCTFSYTLPVAKHQTP